MNHDTSQPTEVALIGMGNVASAYLRTLDELVVRGVARRGLMCARDRARWPPLVARRPGLNLVQTAHEVFESDASVVVILTPPDSHAPLVRDALEHGKHVVVEKPLALSAREGAALIEIAHAAGLNLLSAPFVTLCPTFQQFAAVIESGEIGTVHSARALYGNLGSDWAPWYHEGVIGPLAEVGVYNLQSLTTLLGPVAAVQAAGRIGIAERRIGDLRLRSTHPDSVQVMLHHVSGAVSAVLASHAIAQYRRPAIELYGSEGTAYLQGDDWDPTGIEVWRTGGGRWESYEALDPTWHWTDGLREAVMSLREHRPPLIHREQDVHLLEVIDAAHRAQQTAAMVEVKSRFARRRARVQPSRSRTHLHDHTRSPVEQ